MGDLVDKLLPVLPNFFEDLVSMFAGPKTFLESRAIIRKGDITRALVFMGICDLVYFLFRLPFQAGWVANLTVVIPFVAAIEVMYFLVGLLLFRLVWKIVGGSATLRELIVPYAYFSGSLSLVMAPFTFLATSINLNLYPEDWADRAAHPVALMLTQPVPKLVNYVENLGMVATCIFAIVVWGAFREANKIVSKKRSAVAGILYIVALLFQTPMVLSVEAQLSDLGIAHQSTAAK